MLNRFSVVVIHLVVVFFHTSILLARTVTIGLDHDTRYQRDFEMTEIYDSFSDQTIMMNSAEKLIPALEKLKLSDLGLGDQLMIGVSTHGCSIRKSDHSVTAGHVLSLSKSELNLTKTIPYLEGFAARGIHIAVIDTSCFSAPSLLLGQHEPLRTSLCAITGDSGHMSATSTFSNRLWRNEQNGGDLESIFLRARLSDISTFGSPGISTEAGKLTSNALSFLASTLQHNSLGVVNMIDFTKKFFVAGMANKDFEVQRVFPNLKLSPSDADTLRSVLVAQAGKIQRLDIEFPDLIAKLRRIGKFADGSSLTWADIIAEQAIP